MAEQKFCKDCKHQKLVGWIDRCYRPQLGKDLVTGEQKSIPCSVERCTTTIGCTEDGQYFEPKSASDPKPSLLRRMFDWFGDNGLQ